MNKKLSKNRKDMMFHQSVDIGCAIEVDSQLRVAVVRDVLNKSVQEVKEEVRGYKVWV
jgi:pyruvate/2-oxoglutarate dehydrogenase complex dihydrolipoamide acyltransferase (E2) component